MMPALYAADWRPDRPVYVPDAMSRDERYVFRAVIDDLRASDPTLLIVDRRPRYGLDGFDFLAYFGQDAGFRAWLGGYRPVAAVERYLILRRAGVARP